MAEEHHRPNPDEILARVKAAEKQERRGRLKVFLGYAPGVGKTYAMLEAAQNRKKDTDVVVAWVDTHGRSDTAALLRGLEIFPRRQVEYRGVTLAEMDLDALIARHPQLAVLDELAHENAPGSRHVRRYQDVEELLDAGIDVYTTLNVQHIESGRDVVAQVTGVWMRETVPDSFLDGAAEVELVDLPPDELLKRLKEGKVYVPEQIAPAAANFFRKGNLMALRELAMRTAAKHVDEQTVAYMRAHAIRGPWSSGERLLLYVGPGSHGSSLVRSARRLAYELGAEWTVLNVEKPSGSRLTPGQQDRVVDSIRLAQRLGAKSVTVRGDAAARAVVEFARANNVTKIVVAKPRLRRLRSLPAELTVAQIVWRSHGIDVHMVGSGREQVGGDTRDKIPLGSWRGHLQGLALVAVATAVGKVAPHFFAPANMIMVYLLCVVATAFLWGYGPSIVVSVVSVLVFDFAFIPPVLSFTVLDTKYVFTLIVLLLVGLATAYLMRRIRDQTDAATRRETQTSALYALGRDLAASTSLESHVSAIGRRVRETLRGEAIIFLPDRSKEGSLKAHSDRPDTTVTGNEMAAAMWSFQHQKTAGRGTDTLPNAAARYVPLGTARGPIGVLSLSVNDPAGRLTVDQERLLGAYADLAAVSIEGIQSGEEALQAQVLSQVLKDTEKLQTALLNSISHDLRTPLVSIIGALSSLQEDGVVLDDAAKKSMVEVAREEAERLNRLIANLLDMSRLESGALKITSRPAEVQDLVGAALEQLGDRIRVRPVKTELPEDLPFISVDFGLIVQALVNVLDNAIKYSPAGSPIDIVGRLGDHEIRIDILDRGSGIPVKDLPRLFDRSYSTHAPDNARSTGLGLSICKGIVEAHKGRITAENRPGGGTIISLILPSDVAQPGNEGGGSPHA